MTTDEIKEAIDIIKNDCESYEDGMVYQDAIRKLLSLAEEYLKNEGEPKETYTIPEYDRGYSDACHDWKLYHLKEIEKHLADKFTYCAYCGKEFEIDKEGSNEEVSKHIHLCERHPIADYKAEIEKLLKQKQAWLDGLPSKEEIEKILKESSTFSVQNTHYAEPPKFCFLFDDAIRNSIAQAISERIKGEKK